MSMSDRESPRRSTGRGWMLVNHQGDVESGDDNSSSTSSLEFVNLDEDVAAFHIKERVHTNGGEEVNEGEQLEEPQVTGAEQSVSMEPLGGSTEHRTPSPTLSERSSSDAGSEAVILDAVVDPLSAQCEPLDTELEEGRVQPVVLEEQMVAKEDMCGEDKPTPSSVVVKEEDTVDSCERNRQKEDWGMEREKENDEATNRVGAFSDGDLSSIEVLSQASEDLEDSQTSSLHLSPMFHSQASFSRESSVSTEDQELKLVGSASSRAPVYRRQTSDTSDSDSDYVCLDAKLLDESYRGSPRGEAMQSSGSSMSSSISSVFRFVHPIQRPLEESVHREDDEDSVPDCEDDRPESDISGMADTDDSDLSNMVNNLGDIPLTAGDVVRSYRHRPNTSLNSTLTVIALLALFTTLGIGMGHFMGSSREASLRKQRVTQMKLIQDEYLMCLRSQEILQQQVDGWTEGADDVTAKYADIADMWKQSYADVLTQKTALETKMNVVVEEKTAAQQQAEIDRDLQKGLKADLATSVAGREALQTELEGAVAERDELIQKSERLQAELEGGVAERVELIERIESLQAELEGGVVERDELIEKTESLQAELEGGVAEGDKMLLRGDQVKGSQDMSQDLRGQLTQLEHTLHEHQLKQTAANSDMQSLRQLLNEMQVENQELRGEVARVRYGQHQLKMEMDLDLPESELKDRLNDLANENEDLKSVVGRIRYSRMLGEDSKPGVEVVSGGATSLDTGGEEDKVRQSGSPADPVQYVVDDSSHAHTSILQDVTRQKQENLPQRSADEQSEVEKDTDIEVLQQRIVDIQDKLTLETGRAQMWRNLLVTERTTRKQHQSSGKSSQPNFLACMRLLVPNINLSDLTQHDLVVNTTHVMLEQLAFLRNLTTDTQFAGMLREKWAHFEGMMESTSLADLTEGAERVYEDMRQAMARRWAEFHDDTTGEDFKKHMKETADRITDSLNNLTSKGKFADYLNKTRKVVDEVSTSLQLTWEKVKSMSTDFLDNHADTFNSLHSKVKAGFNKVGQKVKSKWQKVRDRFQKKGKKQQHFSKHNHDGEQHKQSHQGHKGQQHKDGWKQEKKEKDDYNADKHNKFEDKPQHRQKQSSHESERPKEFINYPEVEPEELMEGFLEGNNKEWRKHQKTFRKMHSRIHKLNEGMLINMDDDDIEDIYDDLEDFEDDIEDEVQPEGLKDWLKCQIRWWKSRFQRKKRNEDVLMGCGRNLMHWQLRAICQPVCHGKKCKSKHQKQLISNCDKLQQILSSQDYNSHTQNVPVMTFNTESQHHESSGSLDPVETPEDTNGFNQTVWDFGRVVGEAKSNWYFQQMQDREDHRIDPTWYVKRLKTSDDSQEAKGIAEHKDQDLGWWFGRATDLEYRQHSTDWVFSRASKRDLERNKPWYMARAEEREQERGTFKP